MYHGLSAVVKHLEHQYSQEKLQTIQALIDEHEVTRENPVPFLERSMYMSLMYLRDHPNDELRAQAVAMWKKLQSEK